MFEVTLYGLKCPFLFRFRLIFDLKKETITSNIKHYQTYTCKTTSRHKTLRFTTQIQVTESHGEGAGREMRNLLLLENAVN